MMNKEHENKLLVFFAANAEEKDYNDYMERFMYRKLDDLGNSTNTIIHDSKFTREEAKFIYAKKMVEKYKEFCHLLDDNPTSEVSCK